MTEITQLAIESWAGPCSALAQTTAIDALEKGDVLLLPKLDFALHDDERALYFQNTGVEVKGKNISLNLADNSVRGSHANAAELGVLRDMMVRFATDSRALVHALLPGYVSTIEQGRTSFRPVEVAGRASSWRKDDTRLHVDSFPSSPTRGKRILRLFTNVNPHGQGRNWRLGERFEDVARRYLGSLPEPLWGSSQVLAMLGITKGRRSNYDHFMLQLHDRMKADSAYQASGGQREFAFAPGCTWLVYTDQVPHAAMSGRFLFEQTFYLPVAGMHDPATSPLRVLERLMGRELA